MTTAAAPASSRRRILSTVCESGDEEATMGFFKTMFRYFVVRFMAALFVTVYGD
jgi:hypothetical protein